MLAELPVEAMTDVAMMDVPIADYLPASMGDDAADAAEAATNDALAVRPTLTLPRWRLESKRLS